MSQSSGKLGSGQSSFDKQDEEAEFVDFKQEKFGQLSKFQNLSKDDDLS
jgi:hypothetical protein